MSPSSVNLGLGPLSLEVGSHGLECLEIMTGVDSDLTTVRASTSLMKTPWCVSMMTRLGPANVLYLVQRPVGVACTLLQDLDGLQGQEVKIT